MSPTPDDTNPPPLDPAEPPPIAQPFEPPPGAQTPPTAPPPIPAVRTGTRCIRCGYDLRGRTVDQVCPECGTPVHESYGLHRTSGMAIASMVLGILAIVMCFFYGIPSLIFGVLALVFARKAEAQIDAKQASTASLGMVKAGRICGWIGIGLGMVWVAFVFVIVLANVGGF